MHGLDINMQSFRLKENLVNEDDKIRVSITTIPEENKQSFIIDYKQMNYVHHVFTTNISKKTKKIIFVFRKKSVSQNDPIIASTVIFSDEFPKSKNDQIGSEMKTFNLYEPISDIKNLDHPYPYEHRRIFGDMQIQFRLTDIFSGSSISSNNKHNNARKNKTNSLGKSNSQKSIIIIDANQLNISPIDN